jgi:hypothetical protein
MSIERAGQHVKDTTTTFKISGIRSPGLVGTIRTTFLYGMKNVGDDPDVGGVVGGWEDDVGQEQHDREDGQGQEDRGRDVTDNGAVVKSLLENTVNSREIGEIMEMYRKDSADNMSAAEEAVAMLAACPTVFEGDSGVIESEIGARGSIRVHDGLDIWTTFCVER